MRTTRDGIKIALCFGLLFAWLLWLYSPALNAPLFVDDPFLIQSPQILAGLELESLKTIFRPGSTIDYYPIRDLSYLVDSTLFAGKISLYRIHQLIIFWETSIVLFLLLVTIGTDRTVALVASVFWACHPVHVEMVSWLSGRKDILAIFFGCAAVALFLRAARKDSTGLYCASGLVFLLSCLSKGSLTTLPIFGLAAALLRIRLVSTRSSAGYLVAYSVIGICFSLFTGWYYTHVNDMRADYDVLYRVQASSAAFARMTLGWVNPRLNIFDMENWGDWLNSQTMYIFFGIFEWLVLIAVGVVALLKRNFSLFLPILAGLMFYLPVSGLVFPHRNFYSVRYLEPLFFVLVVSVAAMASHWIESARPGRRRLVSLVVAAIVMVLSNLTIEEAETWSAPIKVFEKARLVRPESTAIKVLEYSHLVRISGGEQVNSTLKSQLRSDLELVCGSSEEDVILPCAGFWVALFNETPTNDTRRRRELLERNARALSKDPFAAKWALTPRQEFNLLHGELDRASFDEWARAYVWKTDSQERLIDWIYECLLEDPRKARETLSTYYRSNLLSVGVLETFVSYQVNQAFWPRLKQCLTAK